MHSGKTNSKQVMYSIVASDNYNQGLVRILDNDNADKLGS